MCEKMKAQTYIKISLAYAPSSGQQYYQELDVPMGTTIYEALQFSGWLGLEASANKDFAILNSWCEQTHQELSPNAKEWFIGVYADKKPLNYVLSNHDRIEIYRALSADPMNRRKNKAKKKVR